MNEARARRQGEYSTNPKGKPGRPKKVTPDYPPGVSVGELSPLFDFSRKPWLVLAATLRQLIVAHNILKWTKTAANWANRETGRHLRVLDAACGYGEQYTLLRDARRTKGTSFTYIGVELDQEKVAVARLLRRNIDVREMDVLNISSLDEEPFDVVISADTLEHLTKPDGIDYFQQLVDAVATNGIIVMTVPTPNHHNKTHKYHLYEWSRGELLNLVEDSGLLILDEFTLFSHKREWDAVFDPQGRLPVDIVRPVASCALNEIEGTTQMVIAEKL